MGITRRDLLKGVAVGTVAIGCSSSSSGDPPGADANDPPPRIDPPDAVTESMQFPLGVSAGDIAGNHALVWTRYAGTAALTAYVWRLDGDTYVEELGPFAATPNDGFVHVAIEGLRAGAQYRYTFFEGDRTARSKIGRFRTPADGANVVTFGAISCTDSGRATDPIARAAVHPDLDAFLFLGDNAYCDGAKTLADYRDKYDEHFGRPAHVDLRASTGMYITWDDHEVDNDWNPETIAAPQIAAAFQTFFDHAPYLRNAQSPNRIWRSARWGTTVEVFVLDCRSERKPSTRSGANAQYISPEQLAWLEQGLATSPCRFKLIMNSVPITNMPNVWDLYKVDRWEAYAAQRTRILQYIDDQQIKGVLWLSGDFHLAFISKVATSGAGMTQREVLCGPGGQSPNALLPSLTAPQFGYKTGTNNYTTLRFDPAAGEVRVTYVDGSGSSFHSEAFVL
ncbi:MAG: alkaline phosphatase D family protein [Deltaproteobacteria bacterium]|nr:alkaline phosphatase D family protein [Deltaproteobacteria bacterium]